MEHQPARLFIRSQQGFGNVFELAVHVAQEPDASQSLGVLLIELGFLHGRPKESKIRRR